MATTVGRSSDRLPTVLLEELFRYHPHGDAVRWYTFGADCLPDRDKIYAPCLNVVECSDLSTFKAVFPRVAGWARCRDMINAAIASGCSSIAIYASGCSSIAIYVIAAAVDPRHVCTLGDEYQHLRHACFRAMDLDKCEFAGRCFANSRHWEKILNEYFLYVATDK